MPSIYASKKRDVVISVSLFISDVAVIAGARGLTKFIYFRQEKGQVSEQGSLAGELAGGQGNSHTFHGRINR